MSSASAAASPIPAIARLRRWGLRLVALVVAAFVVYYALAAVVSVDTNRLWFRGVSHESVYTRQFWTQALLFAVFALIMAAALTYNLVVFYRLRPGWKPDAAKQRWRYIYHRLERPLHRWILLVIVLYFAVSMGSRAAGGWQTWLAWRNAVSFHQHDPQFHRDISYFLFVYPLHRMVLTFLFRIVATSLILVLVAGWLYGAIRFRGPKPRTTPQIRAHVSILLGIYFVLKAFAYWLDRFALATSNRGVVTGPSYTDVHAAIPGKLVLVVFAAICAAILFANAMLRSVRLIVIGVGTLAIAALVFGVLWPGAVQRFRDKPAASQLELPYIKRNIANTDKAFGISPSAMTIQTLPATPTLSGPALSAQVARNAQIRLIDPNQLSAAYNVLQQVRSFYTFKSTLDIDRYPINGKLTDVAIAAREFNLSGLSNSQITWSNTHLVYTHGYGVVAAPTDQMSEGAPKFVEGNIPATGVLGLTTPQIYYGQKSNSYSIVGNAPGAKAKEFDHPSTEGGAQASTTHVGGGGVPLGSLFDRLVYAWKMHSSSILFSSEINSHSQLIYNTNPRNRVAAVAPWLTLDGDVYPVVVDGQIDWVVDGYTTSNNYPYSQQINLRKATNTTLTSTGSTVTQPNTQINYMRNDVKALVNAYSGKVTLYQWDPTNTADPVLATWEKAFPGLVQPQQDIPTALLPHLRYPQDLFNVQRFLLARYHVTTASDFYSGSGFWQIPNDPVGQSTTTTNSLGTKVNQGVPNEPSTYMTLSPNGTTAGVFSLSTPMVTLGQGLNLAAFLSVDSQPGPGYGHFTLLEAPPSKNLESPSLIQNEIESDTRIANRLSLERAGNSKVILGNQEAMPLAGQMLYVEPIYTEAKRTSSPNPILQHVVTVYGDRIGFAPTLAASLAQSLDVPASQLLADGVPESTAPSSTSAPKSTVSPARRTTTTVTTGSSASG